jgi:hypothetical protein
MANETRMGEELRRHGLLFIIVMVALVLGAAALALKYEVQAAQIAVIGFIAVAVIMVAFAGTVLWQIVNGKIELVGLIAEPGNGGVGKASLSRFQMLIFTFVIAGLFLMLSIETGGFVDVPTNVLGLLGISGGSYLIAKATTPPPKDSETPTPNDDKPASGKKRRGSASAGDGDQ